MMVIHESITGFAPAIIFIILFGSMIFYLMITIGLEKHEYNKMTRCQKMIEDGHKKAINGNKHDGLYRENKYQKYHNEVEKCKEDARKAAKSDMRLLQ